MDKKEKRKKILKVSGLIGLFLLVFGLSYALFTVTLNGTKKVKVKTGKLELQLLDANNNPIYSTNNNNTSSYEINLDNQVPVDDTTGLGTEAFEFKLKNNGSIKASYTIYLDDVALEVGENRLADKYVRYSLTKNGNSDSAQDLTNIGVNPNRKLDEGVLDTQDVNTYTLKVWIKESADNNAMDKVFNATLRVEGVQYVPPVTPNYGEEIAETQLTETITATYYQPEDTGYNNTTKVKRMSNVKKMDNEERYEGGTLVISGEGEIPDFDDGFLIYLFLGGYDSLDGLELDSDGWPTFPWDDNFVYKYSPSSVIIEEGINSIGEGAFRRLSFITTVTISSSVKTIGEGAFYDCSLTKITLSNGLETIGDFAFENNSIEKLVIPDTVTSIGDESFANNNLISVTLNEGVNIASHAFADFKGESITIPSSVNLSGNYVFHNSNNLSNIYILGNITMSDRAFYELHAEIVNIHCPNSTVYNQFLSGYGEPSQYGNFNLILDE